MASLIEIMQLCRLCLVKDQVNIPIFEEQGDIRQIFLKISACLPVKVSREDNLPKKICDTCSSKLESLYQFWNTSANSEKQLLKWLSQVGVEKTSGRVAQSHSINSDGVVLKQEVVELADTHSVDDDLAPDDLNISNDAHDYILQQQQLPYQPLGFQFQQDGFTEGEGTSSTSGPSATVTSEAADAPKRKRRAAAMKALPAHIDSEEEDEDDVDMVETKIAKTEEQTDESGAEDPEPTAFVGVPSTSADNEQPGPSGVGKGAAEATWQNEMLARQVVQRGVTNKTKFNQSNTGGQVGPVPAEPFCVMEQNSTVVVDNGKFKEKLFIPVTQTQENPLQYNILLPADKKFIQKGANTVILLPPVKTDQETKENNGDTKNKIVTLKFINVQQSTDVPNNENRKYKCCLCGERFCTPNLYRDHMNVHEDMKPYKCNKCNSVFSTAYLRNQHKSFHAPSTKLEVCKLCGLSFKRLNQHLEKTHNAATCTRCGEQVKDMEYHMKTMHKLSCDQCLFKCEEQEDLQFHKEEAHSAKYECAKCGVSYFSATALKSHQLAH